jgi:phosphopentomutase
MKIMPSNDTRVIWIILDGVGVGALPDASEYDDEGANTLGNLAEALGGLNLPNLEALGLGNLTNIIGVAPYSVTRGAYGKMIEVSPGKDSTTGHWELAGVILDRPFPVYPKGFPPEVREGFEELIGIEVLGNKPASGTEIIEELGKEHLKTGKPILYTSVDSVFQLAAHKEVIPLNELYHMCEVAREMLRGEHMISRVIARPFIGSPGGFERIGEERMDLSLPPPRPTVLDLCSEAGMPVKGVGKVGDLYAGRGFESSPHTSGNLETMDMILKEISRGGEGIIMANLVDFDMLYGHRRDCLGFARGLKEFDDFLPELKRSMKDRDICVVASDHGCDPTYGGTDHTREYTLLLVFGKEVAPGIDLGIRGSFADCGKSIADLLGIKAPELDGTSFTAEVLLPA